MKIFGWGESPDFAIQVSMGSKGKWRWSLLHNGDTVALSPVKGWDTPEQARDACHAVLDGIGANTLKETSDGDQ